MKPGETKTSAKKDESYERIDAKCPYYKDETSHSIRCEGIISEACVNNFRGPQLKKEYERNHCDSKYQDCKLCKALESKY